MKKVLIILVIFVFLSVGLIATVIMDRDKTEYIDLTENSSVDYLVDAILEGSLDSDVLFVFEDSSMEGYNYVEYRERCKQYFRDLIISENLNDRALLRKYVLDNQSVIQADLNRIKDEVEKLVIGMNRDISLFDVDIVGNQAKIVFVLRNDLGDSMTPPEGLEIVLTYDDSDKIERIDLEQEITTVVLTDTKNFTAELIEKATGEVWYSKWCEVDYNPGDHISYEGGVNVFPLGPVGSGYRYEISYNPFGSSGIVVYDYYYNLTLGDETTLRTWEDIMDVTVQEPTYILIDFYGIKMLEGTLRPNGEVEVLAGEINNDNMNRLPE